MGGGITLSGSCNISDDLINHAGPTLYQWPPLLVHTNTRNFTPSHRHI